MNKQLRAVYMKRMRNDGYSYRIIGETFNMSHEQVRQILDKQTDKSIIKEKVGPQKIKL